MFRFRQIRQSWLDNRKIYLADSWREKAVPLPMFLLEILILIAVTLGATGSYLSFDSQTQLPGREAEWLTSSSLIAQQSYGEYGYIPTWNPYYEWGEPLVNNPFTFVLNPISTFPVFIWGHVQGVKVSVVLYALLAGLGGWYLGYVLGFGSIGRVMLGILLIGKGTMHANIMEGYYQLGVAQAYIPWVCGAAIHTLRTKRAFPPVLTALSFTLMFYAGNIWHILPTVLGVFLLALAHFNFPKEAGETWNQSGFMRLVFAGVLTLGLSAASLVPIWVYQGSIGGHDDEVDAGWVMPRDEAFKGYFDSSFERVDEMEVFVPKGAKTAFGEPHFYYSYVIPFWFFVLIFVIIPPIHPLTHISGISQSWRIWAVGLFMFSFATLWGMGGTGLFKFLYEYVPLLGQWRFVGRAFATSSFWLAVMIAMRVDGLWRSLRPYIANVPAKFRYGFFYAVALGVFLFSNAVAFDSVRFWQGERDALHTVNIATPEASCLEWLRESYPNKEFNVWQLGYVMVRPFVENRIRLVNIEADFIPIELTPTIGAPNLGLLGDDAAYILNPQGAYLTHYVDELGYQGMENAPLINGNPCIYYNAAYDAPYASWITRNALVEYWDDRLGVFGEMRPTLDYLRLYDRIYVAAKASSNEDRIVVVQERALQGWKVYVDDKPADLEIIGGWIGVRLPPDDQNHLVYFVYKPLWLQIGISISLISFVIAAVYLIIPQRLSRWANIVYSEASSRIVNQLREFDPFPEEQDEVSQQEDAVDEESDDSRQVED